MRQHNISVFQQWIGEVMEERDAELLLYWSLPVSKAWSRLPLNTKLAAGNIE
jgi:hypothetical protein